MTIEQAEACVKYAKEHENDVIPERPVSANVLAGWKFCDESHRRQTGTYESIERTKAALNKPGYGRGS
jgi:hypothetical protein